MCWFKANEADERDRHRKPQQPYRTQLQLLRTGFERKKAQVLLVQLLRLLRLMASLLLLLRMRLAAFVTRLIFRTLTKKLFCIDLGSSTIVAVDGSVESENYELAETDNDHTDAVVIGAGMSGGRSWTALRRGNSITIVGGLNPATWR